MKKKKKKKKKKPNTDRTGCDEASKQAKLRERRKEDIKKE